MFGECELVGTDPEEPDQCPICETDEDCSCWDDHAEIHQTYDGVSASSLEYDDQVRDELDD